jgi:hypothetical protein
MGGKPPGWVIVSPDAPDWARQKLSLARLTDENGSPPFRVYADDGGTRWPQGGRVRVSPSEVGIAQAATAAQIALPVAFEGGLTLLGYKLDQTTFKPGDTVSIETAWRVDQVPGQLISLMAHLMGLDGQAVAVGDSLGMPIEYMQAGDVFVQRHTLTLAHDTPSGRYWFQTGIHSLENDTRWPVRDARAKGNRAILAPIEVKP